MGIATATTASASNKKAKTAKGKKGKVDSASPEAGSDDEESKVVKDEPEADNGGLDDVFD